VDTGTVEAEYRAEGYGCPLRIFHATVAAFVITWYGFDHHLVTGGHLHHFAFNVGCKKLCVQIYTGSVDYDNNMVLN